MGCDKIVVWGNFIVWNTYSRKEKFQANGFRFYFRKVEQKELKCKVSRKKELIKTRDEINETEKQQKIHTSKS